MQLQWVHVCVCRIIVRTRVSRAEANKLWVVGSIPSWLILRGNNFKEYGDLAETLPVYIHPEGPRVEWKVQTNFCILFNVTNNIKHLTTIICLFWVCAFTAFIFSLFIGHGAPWFYTKETNFVHINVTNHTYGCFGCFGFCPLRCFYGYYRMLCGSAYFFILFSNKW